jgi:sulfate adenylyltransferase subunit 1
MDLVDFSQEVYDNIRREYAAIAEKLNLTKVYYIPISARDGDNVVNPSEHTPWYQGETLLHLLETLPLKSNLAQLPMRLPVQYVIRPQSARWPDYRAYAGRLASGVVKVGDEVTILPSNTHSTVTAIDEADHRIPEAAAPRSVAVSLADDVDVSRGCMIVKRGEEPHTGNEFSLLVCWFNHRPLNPATRYIIRQATDEAVGIVRSVDYKVNINTLELNHEDKRVEMNDIVHLRLKVSKQLSYDAYRKNRGTGSLIFIDPETFETVGAGMITEE